MKKDIKQSWHYNQPPEMVWDYLTKPELLEQWLMKNDFLPIVGHNFQFRTKGPMPDINFNGIFSCTVLEVIPYKKLSYSWRGAGMDGSLTLDSIVVWTLEHKDGGTDLLLVQSGFSENELTLHAMMTEGWAKNIKKISDLLNNPKS